MKRIFTVGVYDLLHKGHVELFRRAKKLGDFLIVAVQDSDMVYEFKPEANLINNTEDRVYMVDSIKYVDKVVVYQSVYEIIQKVDFDVFVTGPDQIHDGFIKAIEWCTANGKQHVVISRTEGVSSSGIKNRLKG